MHNIQENKGDSKNIILLNLPYFPGHEPAILSDINVMSLRRTFCVE